MITTMNAETIEKMTEDGSSGIMVSDDLSKQIIFDLRCEKGEAPFRNGEEPLKGKTAMAQM